MSIEGKKQLEGITEKIFLLCLQVDLKTKGFFFHFAPEKISRMVARAVVSAKHIHKSIKLHCSRYKCRLFAQ